MIKNLFFPEKIGSYFLFQKKTVGFHITKNALYATVVIAKGTAVTIENTYKEPLENPEQIVDALSKIIRKIKSYDALITTIDSSFIVFKELTLPILGEEKIALILPFEIEPYLPFPADQANIDFIITKENKTEKTTSILVAAIQKKYITDHIDLFSQANLFLSAITVDIINVFGLYQKISPINAEDNSALILCDDTKTHIAYLKNGTLKKIRTLQKNLEIQEGIFQQIGFTLNSFIQEEGPIQKIEIMGEAPQDLLEKIKDIFSVPCESLNLRAALMEAKITIPATQDAPLNFLSLAAAYPSSLAENFNLLKNESVPYHQERFKVQLIIGIILSIAIITSLSVHTFLQIRNLSSIAEQTKNRAIADLKKNFTEIKGKSLKEAVKNARKQIQKEEAIWFSFSSQTQHSFLKYLFDLSTKVDREVLGLDLAKMVINKETITLNGKVRNFEAIDEFEKELRETELFSEVPLLQQITFNPLVLPIAHQGGFS